MTIEGEVVIETPPVKHSRFAYTLLLQSGSTSEVTSDLDTPQAVYEEAQEEYRTGGSISFPEAVIQASQIVGVEVGHEEIEDEDEDEAPPPKKKPRGPRYGF
jgi:hypothetical protein